MCKLMLASHRLPIERLFLVRQKQSTNISNRLVAKVSMATFDSLCAQCSQCQRVRKSRRMLVDMITLNLLIQSKEGLYRRNLFPQLKKVCAKQPSGEFLPVSRW